MYHTYILRCADDTLYVGSTNKLEKRFREHNTSKSGAHYTKIRRPVVLEYSQECAGYSEARALEAQWKRLTRQQKLDLITTNKAENIAI
jgi:putative endonuclease